MHQAGAFANNGGESETPLEKAINTKREVLQ
jgi:hypothetical protein